MSDILIKGLEMPKEGGTVLILYHNGVVEEHNVTIVGEPKKKSDSVAIPVPEHGDLIDRDALVARFQHNTSHPTGYEVVSKIFDAEVVLERTT